MGNEVKLECNHSSHIFHPTCDDLKTSKKIFNTIALVTLAVISVLSVVGIIPFVYFAYREWFKKQPESPTSSSINNQVNLNSVKTPTFQSNSVKTPTFQPNLDEQTLPEVTFPMPQEKNDLQKQFVLAEQTPSNASLLIVQEQSKEINFQEQLVPGNPDQLLNALQDAGREILKTGKSSNWTSPYATCNLDLKSFQQEVSKVEKVKVSYDFCYQRFDAPYDPCKGSYELDPKEANFSDLQITVSNEQRKIMEAKCAIKNVQCPYVRLTIEVMAGIYTWKVSKNIGVKLEGSWKQSDAGSQWQDVIDNPNKKSRF